MVRRIATALVLVAALIGAVVMAGAGGSATGKHLRIAFDNAFGLTRGGDLRIGGVKAGKTSDFKVSHGPECQNPDSKGPPRSCAIVIGDIEEPGFQSIREDAKCAIRQQSLIGEYYVDCQPGNSSKPLPGDTINVHNTQSTVPADLVNNVLRRPYRERLRIILAELGTGLAGRPADLAEVLKRAHPGLRETSRTLKILGNQTQIIRNFIKDSDTVVAQLDQKKQEVARWIHEAGRTAEISASRRDAIAAGFQRLPTFLDELKPTMAQLGALTDQQTPLLRDLHRSAPALTELFTRLGPFADASLPAFRSLGRAGDAGRRAIADSTDEIKTLKALASDAPRLGKPLRQLLQSADDRHMAVDDDPRAAESAPPAPDRNSNSPTKRAGFTAFESLLNYIYWQTLGLNSFDNVSHTLRTAGYVLPNCDEIQNDLKSTPEQVEIRNRCNSYLGPYHPGIDDPDPTLKSSGHAVDKPTAARKKGERRTAGQPRALPLPGQYDPSVPHVVLPPAVQALVDRLRHGGPDRGRVPKLPNVPGLPRLPRGSSGSAAPDQMLDFLLSP